MVSSEQQALATKRLSQWLGNDKRIVTYREVSREVGCHVNAAKNILLRHFNGNSSLAPTYVLTGTLKPTSHLAETTLDPSAPPSPKATQSFAHLSSTQGLRIVDMDEMSDADRNSEPDLDDGIPNNDEGAADGLSGESKIKVDREDDDVAPERVATWGVVIVQADKLDEKKALFEPEGLSISIYALAPAPVKDSAQYLIPELSVRAHKAYFKPDVYGTISGDAFKPAQAGAMKDGGMEWGKKTVKEGKKAEPPKAEKKEEKKEAPKADTKKEEVKVKEEPVDTKPNIKKETSASKPAAKSTKPTTKQRKRVIESDDEEEESVESPTAGPSTSKTKEPTSSLTRQDDQAAMEAMMDMDFEMSEGEESKPSVKKEKTEVGDVVKVKTEPGQRKRRKVKKSKKVMEGKYMVTQDYWSEESYSGESEPESQTKAAPKAAPPKKAEPPKPLAKPAPKPSASAKGGQATLMGFFKKK